MQFRANGKLLLTGEYFVLDGARALAVPTQLGQQLTVSDEKLDGRLHWRALDHQKEVWLEVIIDLDNPDQSQLVRGDQAGLNRLLQLIDVGRELRPGLLTKLRNKQLETRLEFPRDWGLGSSSTLLHLLGQYWEVDPFKLLEKTFGGSGYDLVCAGVNHPVEYWRAPTGGAHWRKYPELPAWVSKTHFVHLNQKQNSREGIRAYREKEKDAKRSAAISELTAALANTSLLRESIELLEQHEKLVADHLELVRVRRRLFPDFPGLVKSLGAWGGDFVWVLTAVLSAEQTTQYFKEKGYETILPWSKMVLNG